MGVCSMDVILINPVYNERSEIPPLGLECIASVLLRDGIDAAIIDLDVDRSKDPYDYLSRQIERYDPAIVGITAMSNSFDSAVKVCQIVKKINPDILAVLGGIHPTVLYGKILEEYKTVDAIVRGEGEYSFLELVNSFFDAPSFLGIRGVSFRDGGKIINNRKRELIKNLDGLPPPAHDLVKNEEYKMRSISSSRGCFHNCSFCSIQSLYHNTVRVRCIMGIIKEIDHLIALGAKRIMFTDDNFTFSEKRVQHLCNEIVRHGFDEKVEFFAEGIISDINKNPRIAQILSDAGFKGIYTGAESGSKEILDYYRKGINSDDIYKGTICCIEQNLYPVVNFILYGPKDTVETMKQTIKLAKRLFENGAEISYTETLIPYPGTPIKEELERDGKFLESRGVYYFDSYTGMDTAWLLQLFDLSREITNILHGGEMFFETKKVYFQLDYLDSFLSKKIPPELQMRYDRCEEEGYIPVEVESVYKKVKGLIDQPL